MKKSFCLIILFCFLFVLKSQQTKLCEDSLTERAELGIKKIETFKVKKRDTSTWSIKKWNEKGYLISELYFDYENDTSEFNTYQYNEKGQLIFAAKIGREKKYNRFIEYKFNSGCLVNEKYYGINGDTVQVKHKVDESEGMKKKVFLIKTDTIEAKYLFNKKGLLTEKVGYPYYPKEQFYEYDDADNLISVFDNKKEIDIGYTYDLNSNKIEKRMYSDDEIVQRTIYKYDFLGRITFLKNTVFNKLFKTVKYTYNDLGERTASVYYKKHKKPDEIFFQRIEKW